MPNIELLVQRQRSERHRLALDGLSDRSATPTSLCRTTGHRRTTPKRGDLLFVEWRDGPAGSWTQIASHALLGTGTHSSALWSLPDAAGVADFEFRYRVAVNANNEGATIDNVVLSGHRAADEASAVAEPGSLALAGLGLCLLPVGRARGATASSLQAVWPSAASGSGRMRSAQTTPATSSTMPASVAGAGASPRSRKA